MSDRNDRTPLEHIGTMYEPNTNQEAIKEEDCILHFGDLTLDEIVGQPKAVDELRNLIDSIKYKDLYKLWGINQPKGILLSGPTGVGKTASVRAMARELIRYAVVMQLRFSDIASKWVGEPIMRIRSFFNLAEQKAQSMNVVIFIDEIDAMLPCRDAQIHESSMKIVNVFLEWMDGGFNKINNITVIGATNFIDGIDKAARRSGRFDKIIEFNELKKEDIIAGLKIHFKNKKLPKSLVDANIDWNLIGTIVDDSYINGADLPEILNRIINKKVIQHKDEIVNKTGKNFNKLSKNDKAQIITETAPSPISTQDIYDGIKAFIEYKIETGLIKKKGSFGFMSSDTGF